MTGTSDPQLDRARFAASVQDGMAAMLAERGYDPATATALMALDAVQFQFQSRMSKGEFLHRLIARQNLPIEPAQLKGLFTVARIVHGIHRAEPAQATIGLVAGELNIDPSRASRIVADLVAGGYVAREASQTDGRVSVIVLTSLGQQTIAASRSERWQMFLRVFDGWSADDIATFAGLFARYSDGMAQAISADANVPTPT